MRSLATSFRRGVLAIAIGASGFVSQACGDPIPPGWEASHMEPVG